jgi:hypothetical protein
MKKREFFGMDDLQQILLRCVFPGSPLVVVSPLEAPDQTYLLIEGPKEHLAFLYPHLVQLVKDVPVDCNGKWGTWTGVEGYQETGKLTLFYHHGDSFKDYVQLSEHHFRRDIAFYRDLKLAETAFLDIIWGGRQWLYDEIIGLPEELEENGAIEFPRLRLM